MAKTRDNSGTFNNLSNKNNSGKVRTRNDAEILITKIFHQLLTHFSLTKQSEGQISVLKAIQSYMRHLDQLIRCESAKSYRMNIKLKLDS